MRQLSIAIVGATLGSLGVLAACADSSEVAPQVPASDADTAVLPGSEGGIEDAGVEATPGDDASPDAALRTCSEHDLCRTVLPKNQVLRDVWGDGTGTVWAVSNSGSILRWDGTAWTVHVTNKGQQYLTVWGSGATDVWVGGPSGLLHGTGVSPAALVFEPVDIPGDTTIPVTSIWGTGPDDIWAVGGVEVPFSFPPNIRGRVLHYSGGAWMLDDISTTTTAFARVWGTPGTGVWIAGNSSVLGDPDNIWSVMAVVGLYRRAPGSSSFETISLPTPQAAGGRAATLHGANATSDTSIWVFGQTGSFQLGAWQGTSSDSGQTFTWTYQSRNGDFQLAAVWGVDANDVWAAGEYGRVRRWNGTTWNQAALSVSQFPEVAQLNAIWGKAQNDFWIVGDNIALHRTTSNAKP